MATTSIATHDVEFASLYDVVDAKTVAATIRESAEHVLEVALAREGIVASAEQIKRLARELGNNAAQVVCALEIR